MSDAENKVDSDASGPGGTGSPEGRVEVRVPCDPPQVERALPRPEPEVVSSSNDEENQMQEFNFIVPFLTEADAQFSCGYLAHRLQQLDHLAYGECITLGHVLTIKIIAEKSSFLNVMDYLLNQILMLMEALLHSVHLD